MATIKYKTDDGFVSIPASIATKTNAEQGFGIGTCDTSSGTSLEVTLPGYELIQNGMIAVSFENDVPTGASLNVNCKGAKPIYYKGSAITADTIKADNTVMFAYDGTNYVVTSLGGGGSEDGEIVVVRCSASDGVSVAGKTVTINGTQYTLDVTGIASAKVPFGTQYSVVAGSWTDYIAPTTQTFTAGVALREVTVVWYAEEILVDLGLPSGLKWAKRNIDVTRPNGFAASEYQYECSFFSWGNVGGHNPISDVAFNYDWGTAYNTEPYVSSLGGALTGNIPTNSTYDAAKAACGGNWRLPTSTEFQELIDNCDFVQEDGSTIISNADKRVTINNIVGIYLKSKLNNNLIFFPCCGFGGPSTSYNQVTSMCEYWSNTYSNSSSAHGLTVKNEGNVFPQYTSGRFYSFAIRPVQ